MIYFVYGLNPAFKGIPNLETRMEIYGNDMISGWVHFCEGNRWHARSKGSQKWKALKHGISWWIWRWVEQKQKHSDEFKQDYQSRINWWLMLVRYQRIQLEIFLKYFWCPDFYQVKLLQSFPHCFFKGMCLAYHLNDLNLNPLQQGPRTPRQRWSDGHG